MADNNFLKELRELLPFNSQRGYMHGSLSVPEGNTEFAHSKRTQDNLYVTPLIFAMLPVIRVLFRKAPVLRDSLFVGGIGLGVCHGAWLIARSYPDEIEAHQPQAVRPPPPTREAFHPTTAQHHAKETARSLK